MLLSKCCSGFLSLIFISQKQFANSNHKQVFSVAFSPDLIDSNHQEPLATNLQSQAEPTIPQQSQVWLYHIQYGRQSLSHVGVTSSEKPLYHCLCSRNLHQTLYSLNPQWSHPTYHINILIFKIYKLRYFFSLVLQCHCQTMKILYLIASKEK